VLGRTVAFDSVPLRFWTAPILVEFVYGIVAYGLWQRGAFARWHPAIAVALALGGLLSMLLVHPDDSHRAWQWGLPAFIVFVAMLSLEGRWRVPWLWLLIGNASYSLYLTQAYVLQAIQKKVMPLDAFTATQVLMMAAATVVCCAVAVLFFKLIERPSNLWLRRRLLSPRAAAVQRRAPAAYRA
ncbi:MAG TPA: acyltransferase family protein, partial [Burkholderiaceae bacterium]|nr:acyltransferase family protein [Burkholderiaceae bacterium]